MSGKSQHIIIVSLLLGLVLGLEAREPVSFNRDIRPILTAKCFHCHGPDQQKGKLRLDSLEGLTSKKTESGNAALVPGDLKKSELIYRITSSDNDEIMPPAKEKKGLSVTEQELLKAWVKEGGQFEVHWSLSPIKTPAIPKLKESNPIDAFVLAGLKKRKLGFSREADQRTLIRRLAYDLTGLPPTEKELNQFLTDKSPDAYAKLVDYYLASPRYGERWARHWLDVVHYADTHGYDKDKLRRNAWPYRDYVIRSFNEDKPYSKFIKEQLAGDILYPNDTSLIAATGFIVAGPWDFIGHVEVPGSKIDGKVARNLDRDDMVTNTIQTFMSQTVQCARCHNHPFDTITQKDYYSLQAVFAAIGRNDRPFGQDPKIEEKRKTLTAEQNKVRSDLGKANQAIKRKRPRQLTEIDKQIETLRRSQIVDLKKAMAKSKPVLQYSYHSAVTNDQHSNKWIQIDLGKEMPVDQVMLFAIPHWGWDDFGFPNRFTVSVSNDEQFKNSVTLADYTENDFPRPGASPVLIEAAKGTKARFVRMTATRLWNRHHKGKALTSDWIFCLSEMAIISNGKNVARGKRVRSLDSIQGGKRWRRENINDGIYGLHRLEDISNALNDKSPTNGYHSKIASNALTTKWVQVDLGISQILGDIRITPAFPTDWKDSPGFGFPLRFKIEAADRADFSDAKVIHQHLNTDFPNPGNKKLHYKTNLSARFVRFTATKLWHRDANNYALSLAELEVGNDKNLAAGKTVQALDTINTGRWHTKNLVDGFASRGISRSEVNVLMALLPNKINKAKLTALEARRLELTSQSVPEELIKQRDLLNKQLNQLTKAINELAKPGMVYAAATKFKGEANHKATNGKPVPIHILHRGNVTQPKEVVQPAAIKGIHTGVDSQFKLAKQHQEGDRRVALANWITAKANPLTWRSIVNRIWHYHFGSGIVDTPNDFGGMGSQPTHPELLDWLASEFRDKGQSMKAIHRLILNSKTYKQVSSHNQQAAAEDANNQFLWRMNRRRLTAEEIRDAVLYSSGRMNLKMYGPGFMDFKLEKATHSPHYEYHKHSPADPKIHRRSIYRFIVRSQPQPFMTTLDCADPAQMVAKRDETLTALQALAMLNNDFMIVMSQEYAKRLKTEFKTNAERIKASYLMALSRTASKQEITMLSQFIETKGLESYCRLLFNLNEFVYID